jgi:hypothetical protein
MRLKAMQETKRIYLLMAVIPLSIALLTYNIYEPARDWEILDDAYGYEGNFTGSCLKGIRVSVSFYGKPGQGATYDVCSNSMDFYFHVSSDFDLIKIKPVLIPWHDISMSVNKRFTNGQAVALRFRRAVYVELTLSKDQLERLSIPKKEPLLLK